MSAKSSPVRNISRHNRQPINWEYPLVVNTNIVLKKTIKIPERPEFIYNDQPFNVDDSPILNMSSNYIKSFSIGKMMSSTLQPVKSSNNSYYSLGLLDKRSYI